jgi:hypothetical protein
MLYCQNGLCKRLPIFLCCGFLCSVILHVCYSPVHACLHKCALHCLQQSVLEMRLDLLCSKCSFFHWLCMKFKLFMGNKRASTSKLSRIRNAALHQPPITVSTNLNRMVVRGHNPILKTMQNQWPERNDNNQEPLSTVGTSIPVLYYKVRDFNYNQSFIQ